MIAAKTIAKYTCLEAVRNRLPVLLLIIGFIVWGLTGFIGELTVTETSQIQASFMGFIARFFAVLIIIMMVISSCSREFSDKTINVVLSLPYPRYQYYLGKLAGFILLAMATALFFSIPLFFYADFNQVIIWYFSLSLEMIIVSAAALLFMISLGSMTSAFTLTIAFYLLSRSIQTIILISKSPIMEDHSLLRSFMDFLLTSIAWLLPSLNQFARSDWLVYGGANHSDLIANLVQTAIYVSFLLLVALIDIYRKNF